MSKLAALKAAKSTIDFSHLLGYSASSLTSIIYATPEELKYISFDIPKRNGELRSISAPTEKLKLLQRKLANLLEECEREINPTGKSPSHGFKKGRSIFSNAAVHRNKKIVVNFDIKDFFPSINFGRIQGYFLLNRNYRLHKDVARLIAHISCHKGCLPQGAPTSPAISNMICHILDIKMLKLASEYRFNYSRYADDITISTNKSTISTDIILPSELATNKWIAGPRITEIFRESGFEINEKKTRLHNYNNRQEVTGLTVNKIINTRSSYRKKARAMFHSLVHNNYYHFKSDKIAITSPAPLGGALNFIRHINNERAKKAKNAEQNRAMPLNILHQLKSFEKTLFDFFVFVKFVNNPFPLIVCEGKTDYIYINEAIRKLAPALPGDIAHMEGDKIVKNISFFGYTKSAKEIFGLEGGVPQLKILISKYEVMTEKFPSHHFNNPVIVLVDNDEESKSIKKLISDKKKEITKRHYCHFAKNLYIQFIPNENGEKDVAMEDLFPPEVLMAKIDGKKFSKSNHPCGDDEYGKYLFATKIVKGRLNSTHFSRFAELLGNTAAIIKEHAAKKNFL